MTALSPKSFYSYCTRQNSSFAIQSFRRIPLSSRTPFVFFRNQEGEERFHGQTPLHAASHAGHTQLVQLLLNSGSEKDAKKEDGSTPIILACQEGHYRTVGLLLACGANQNATDNHGWTPLHRASYHGHQQVVQLLISSGASIEEHCSVSELIFCPRQHLLPFTTNNPVTHLCDLCGSQVSSSRFRCQPCDFDGCAECFPQQKNHCTPLYLAAQRGHHKIVELLMAAGANPDALASDGSTPLVTAAKNGHLQVVRRLMGEKKFESATHHRTSPLLVASANGHHLVVELLLSKGADKNEINVNGLTPLYLASQNNHHRVVELLLAAGGLGLGLGAGDTKSLPF